VEIGYWKEKMMGYRSDVAYTIRFTDDHDTNNEQSFYTFLLEAKANPQCQIAIAEVEIDHKNKAFYYSARDVKWYDNYPDVMSHMALVHLAEDWAKQVREGTLHCSIGSMFLRVGEDLADVENRYDGDYNDDWVHTSRQIITDWM
jgi:hypothetical protein